MQQALCPPEPSISVVGFSSSCLPGDFLSACLDTFSKMLLCSLILVSIFPMKSSGTGCLPSSGKRTKNLLYTDQTTGHKTAGKATFQIHLLTANETFDMAEEWKCLGDYFSVLMTEIYCTPECQDALGRGGSLNDQGVLESSVTCLNWSCSFCWCRGETASAADAFPAPHSLACH